MYTRLSKILLVAAAALYFTIVAFNNVTGYYTNYLFVSHVMSMDTTFQNNNGMWRAISSPFLFHTFYILIILTELVIAILCWSGAVHLYKSRKNHVQFNLEKKHAVTGLTLALLLWITGFITIAGEWFLMWQSEIWNAQQTAFNLALLTGVLLIYLVLQDSENNA